MRLSLVHCCAAAGAVGLSATAGAQPLSTSITYQGVLMNADRPVNELFDFRFRLYSAAVGGSQLGAELCADDVMPVDGRFTVQLDFGPQYNGQQTFLEIDARVDTGLNCTNTSGFTPLTPRQPMTAAPNALFAKTSSDSTLLAGQAASFYQNASNLTSGTLPGARFSGVYSQAVTLSSASNSFTGVFAGSGSGLTALNASNLASGTLPDARLSGTYASALTLSNASNSFSGSGAGLTALNASALATGSVLDARLSSNVALLNSAQTISGAKTFSAAPGFTAAGAPFTVTSTTKVTNLNADALDGLDSAAFALSSHTHDGSSIISGTVADARLSSNIATLATAQMFTGAKTFATAPSFTNTGAPFSVSNTAVVTNLNADLLDGLSGAAFATASHTHSASDVNAGTLADARLSTNVPLLNAASNAFTGSLSAASLSGTGSGLTALNASNLSAGTVPNLRLSGTYSAALTLSHPSNVLAGDGSALTNLSASSLATGSVPDARLSSLIARTNVTQNFTVQQTFSAQPSFSSPGAPFFVTGTSVVNNLNADLLDGQHGSFYQNASNQNGGTLADARLSGNVPLINAANVFSAAANRFKEINVDAFETNNGTFSGGLLRLGGSGSGEGIASNRTSDANGNRYGIDFYTNGGTRRVSLTVGGDVGIATAAPDGRLQVRGSSGEGLVISNSVTATSGSAGAALNFAPWQSFAGTLTGAVSRVAVNIRPSGQFVQPGYSFTTTLTISIYSGEGTGGALLGSASLPNAVITYGVTTHTIPFGPGVNLVDGQLYTVVVTASPLPSGGPGGSVLSWNGDAYNNKVPTGHSSLFTEDPVTYQDTDLGLIVYANVTDRNAFTITRGGDVGLGTSSPTARLDVNGGIICDYLVERSSIRFKTDVRPLGEATALLDSLVPVRYRPRDAARPCEEIGLIAEQVNAAIPELVAKGSDGAPLGIKYDRLGVIAVGALREQSEVIRALQRENRELKARVDRLEQLVTRQHEQPAPPSAHSGTP